jgi:hypothetical protein
MAGSRAFFQIQLQVQNIIMFLANLGGATQDLAYYSRAYKWSTPL